MLQIELERRKRGLKQADLTKITGIHKAEICRIEKGSRPFPAHAKKLEEFFGKPIKELLQEVK